MHAGLRPVRMSSARRSTHCSIPSTRSLTMPSSSLQSSTVVPATIALASTSFRNLPAALNTPTFFATTAATGAFW